MTKPSGQAFRLVLRSVPSPIPAVVRLRRFLKSALRAYGLRAVKVEAIEENEVNNGKEATESATKVQ